jgi:hypothetical protein
LRLPQGDPRRLVRVRQYLTRRRGLDASLLEPLLESGQLYADGRANAVFVLVAGKVQRPVGAELRGTGPRVWRGMASDSDKDLGYFWIGARAAREIVLCESAIDAISCFQLHPQRICISTSGVRADPSWLRIGKEITVRCPLSHGGRGWSEGEENAPAFRTADRVRSPDLRRAVRGRRNQIRFACSQANSLLVPKVKEHRAGGGKPLFRLQTLARCRELYPLSRPTRRGWFAVDPPFPLPPAETASFGRDPQLPAVVQRQCALDICR